MIYRKIVKQRPLSKSPTATSQQQTSPTNKLQLIVRIRPTLKQEDPLKIITVQQRNTIKIRKNLSISYMKFNKILEQQASQIQSFDCIKKMVESFLQGTNNTIFAYGQTGSGKTYTMFGPSGSLQQFQEQKGILPRALQQILLNTKPKQQAQILLSFYQIYNDKIYDLFSQEEYIQSIDVRQNKQGQITIPQLIHYQVQSTQQAMQLLQFGNHKRSVGQTAAHTHSSRSHSVFQIVLRKNKKQSCLRIVDLAGSQKFKIPIGLSPTQKQIRIQQLKFINGSLSCLGQCISALTQKSRTHIPFRDSKLTRVLSDCLVGKGRLAVIICISPSMSQTSQTLNTLQFANRVKKANIQYREINQKDEDKDYYRLFEQQKQRRFTLQRKLNRLEQELPRLQYQNKKLRGLLLCDENIDCGENNIRKDIIERVNEFFIEQQDERSILQKIEQMKRIVLSKKRNRDDLFDKNILSQQQNNL